MEMNNAILLRGSLDSLPELSHEAHGKKFFHFFLRVPRLSGAVDTLPVIAEQAVMEKAELGGGAVTVRGQIRSRNARTDGVRHLMVFVYAEEILVEDGEPINEVTVEGILCREPTYRTTPLGREICDAMLAVPRNFRRADYLPCILWGSTAYAVAACHTRDRLRISGRLQSRSYTKLTDAGPQEKITYELSAMTAEILEKT
ncbi:MAG: single-stranded DNA-binding protein [Firmicutes bacterium]|nr:single-stranded DNA-binding protein [Bacillota bacterium]